MSVATAPLKALLLLAPLAALLLPSAAHASCDGLRDTSAVLSGGVLELDNLVFKHVSRAGTDQADRPWVYNAWEGQDYSSDFDLKQVIQARVDGDSLEKWNADRSLDVHEVESYNWNKDDESWNESE